MQTTIPASRASQSLNRLLGRLNGLLVIAAAVASTLGPVNATGTKAKTLNSRAYVSRFIVSITLEERAEPLLTLQRISSAHGASCSTPFEKVKELVRIECYGPSKEAAKESADRLWKAIKKVDEERMANELAALGPKPGQDAPEPVRLDDARERLRAAQSHYEIHEPPSLKGTKINAEQGMSPNGP